MSVVGLSGSGLAAVASRSNEPLAGIISGQTPEADRSRLTPDVGVGATLEAGLLARSPESVQEDNSSLADLDWIGQLFADALERLAPTPTTAPMTTQNGPNLAEVSTPIDVESSQSERHVTASIASPLTLGVVVGAIVIGSMRFRLQKKTTLAKSKATTGGDTVLRGPHRRHRAKVFSR
jgi:hypothetical protein